MTPTVSVISILGFVGLPLVVLVRLLRKHLLTLSLEKDGLHARGEVLRIEDGDSENLPVVHYTYRLPDGSVHHDKYRGALDSSSTLVPGAPLDILYLSEDPRQNQPVGGGVGHWEALFGMLGIVIFMCVSLVLIMNQTRQAQAPSSPSPQGELRSFEPQAPRRPPPSSEARPLGQY